MGVIIELAIELSHGDTLGVQRVNPHLLEIPHTGKLRHGPGETLPVRGLSAHGWAHEHKTVPDESRLVELDDLADERVDGLKSKIPAALVNGPNQFIVLDFGLLNTWEKV